MATKIFIDPGHGGYDPGAVGNGVIEQAINLNVSKELNRLLKEAGYSTKIYRTTTTENVLSNKNADLRNRANMANEWGADYFVSIHTNSSVNPLANGALGTVSEKLARSILDSIVNTLGSKDNGVRAANFAVLRLTNMPAVLVELGYLSNSTEALNLNSPAWQKAVAKAIFEGIYKFVKP
ncbi:MAG: N-acetylmuramoyl-L-alanine amidase [Oscillospiraceae bacterium]